MGPRAFAHGDFEPDRDGHQGAAASMGPRAFAHGDVLEACERKLAEWASMGPRAFAHGDRAICGRVGLPGRCFNGAAGFRPRRQAKQLVTRNGYFCFNGAAGFRPRRHGSSRGSLSASTRLQWGRGLSPTETRRENHPHLARRLASMGPRAFAHGDTRDSVNANYLIAASMGPRAFAHGDATG